jgi:hypothetical protein
MTYKFVKGDTLLCLGDRGVENLTHGKKYTALFNLEPGIFESRPFITVISDNGKPLSCHAARFDLASEPNNKVDWKAVSASKGYKTLKAAYIKDVMESKADERKGRRPMRDKAEFLKLFKWIVCRAKHHAIKRNVTIDVIINEWEQDRTDGKHYGYWWLSFYGDYKQPKDKKCNKLPLGIKGVKKYYKKNPLNPKRARERIGDAIRETLLKRNPPRKYPKARWNARDRRVREYRRKEALKKQV